ncbi:glycosyltransferase family 9 protein [Vibrio mediterranei]|uniref:Heptosyltransferase n=1 Tax=Vibrio mediterranei TaxID=689 RepID=A0ABX5DCU0_9VIBR|nr:glycosyltransferase family 9 protein [Vibrio mediterranei]PCD87733.1 heptosyltransferase [Vibrio mediterranei]PRQ67357.1 heptosyltransferase [Vibrio mediterranei]
MRKFVSRLQLLRDQIRHRLGVILFDKPKPYSPVEPASIKHIVFLRTDAKLGDAFVSSFVFKDIKRYDPNIRISVVTAPNMRSLFLDHLGADSVIELRKRPSYKEITKACIQIGQCDLLVSLNPRPKMKDLYFLSQCQAKHIAGLDDSLRCVDIKLGQETQHLHFAQRFALLLEKMGIQATPQGYVIPQTEQSRLTAHQFLSQHNIEKYCVINGYGSGNARKLTGSSIENLVKIIKQQTPELSIVLISSPETSELVENNIASLNLDALHYSVSQSIFDIASIMATAQFTVSVDTATVHMATGLGVPQLAFYHDDQENFAQWHPNSPLSYTCIAEKDTIPDINQLNWADVEQKLSQLISRTNES